MNILHIVDEPYDSGIAHYALTLARGLKDRGHRVHVWGRAGRYPLAQAARLGLETAPLPGLLSLFAVRRRLRGLGVDLVDAHTGSAHTWSVAVSRSLSPAPAVVRTRGDARAPRRTAGGGMLWARTDGFIAANRAILEAFLEAYPGMRTRSRCVYQGIEGPSRIPPEPAGPARVGLVGRLDPVKGHKWFLRAAAGVPGVRIAVAGREGNLTIAELRRAADAEFLGHVPDALEFMAACHLGVVASVASEAISRVALEWMACGRPLVATRVGCLPEFVVDGETGFLVKPGDPEAMAERLARLAGDPALRAEMGRAGRRRYEAMFTLKRFIDETEGFYEATLRGVPSR